MTAPTGHGPRRVLCDCCGQQVPARKDGTPAKHYTAGRHVCPGWLR